MTWSSLRQYNLLVNLSFLSLIFSNSSGATNLANLFNKFSFKHDMSIGRFTTSPKFFHTNCMHSSTNLCIYKKSDDIRIEITLFTSRAGAFSCSRYFINHSKIWTSQCTLMSMSSKLELLLKCLAKYFISLSSTAFRHLKSRFTYLFSSHTWITINSSPSNGFFVD